MSAGITRPLPTVSGEDIQLRVAHQTMTIYGRTSYAVGISGTVPAPLMITVLFACVGLGALYVVLT